MDSQDSSFYPVIAHRTYTDPRNFDNLPARYKQLVLTIVRSQLRRDVDWSSPDDVEFVYNEARHFRIAMNWFDFGLLDDTIENPSLLPLSPIESVASNEPDSQPLSEDNWP